MREEEVRRPVREPEPPLELPADLEAIMRPIDATTRGFLAIEAGRAVEEEAVRQQAQLAALGAECVPRPYLHVTLDDLGEIPPEALEAVVLACERVLDRQPPFTLRVAGICAFPTPTAPRIVGLNVLDPRGRLAGLRQALHEALAAYGFELDARRFWPHVALARLPEGAPPLDGARFTANEVSLRVRSVQVVERAEPDVPGPAWRVRASVDLRAEPTRAENRVDAEAERAALGALLEARLDEQTPDEPLAARAGRRGRGRRRDERPRGTKPRSEEGR
ncbi:MAG: RNA 2',3'-cyclic phosphodiesterase [bacterium]